MEYLVAEQIEEELIGLSASYLTKDKLVIQKEILFNQCLLKLRATPQTMIVRILCDAVEDKEISTEFLYNLIDLSRQNQKNFESFIQIRVKDTKFQSKEKDEKPEESKRDIEETNQLLIESESRDNAKEESHSQSYFGVAASNAITILNVIGYDFSNCDLNNACIMDANLSYGMFEGTNFANAKLQRVIFTGAWLKDAHFERANLRGVDFGEDSYLKTWDDFIRGIAYSPNGRYLAVETYTQTIIYENSGSRYNSFKEVRRFSGSFSTITACPFSIDNKQVLTLSEYQICIWDMKSGELLKRPEIDYKTVRNISSDLKNIVLCEDNKIQKYSVETALRTHLSSMSVTERVIKRDASYNHLNLIVFGVKDRGTSFYESATGRNILKQRQKDIEICKLSSNEKQIASVLKTKGSFNKPWGNQSEVLIQVSDVIRGHSIKVLEDQVFEEYLKSSSLKFEEDRLLCADYYSIYIFDTISANTVLKIKCDFETGSRIYCLRPERAIDSSEKK